ncbi:MAG: hypothetical protein ACE5GO_10250, partial [Anaerolineales bacterium]
MNLENLNLDIRTAAITATVLAFLGTVLYFWGGVRTIRTARKLRFFRKRHEGMVRGWRMLFLSFFL